MEDDIESIDEIESPRIEASVNKSVQISIKSREKSLESLKSKGTELNPYFCEAYNDKTVEVERFGDSISNEMDGKEI